MIWNKDNYEEMVERYKDKHLFELTDEFIELNKKLVHELIHNEASELFDAFCVKKAESYFEKGRG